MERGAEETLILKLMIEHLLTHGEWPELRVLHRRIHKELGHDVDVREVASRLSPSPFSSGYDLQDRFAPPLFQLDRVEEGAALLQTVADFIPFAVERYRSTSGDVEITETELVVEGFDGRLINLLPTLLDRIPFVSSSRSTRDGKWTLVLSDEITRLRDVETKADLLRFLRQVEDASKRETAALAEAKYRMSSKVSPVAEQSELPTPTSHDPVTRLEMHPATRAVRLIGAIAVALGSLVGLVLGVKELLN